MMIILDDDYCLLIWLLWLLIKFKSLFL